MEDANKAPAPAVGQPLPDKAKLMDMLQGFKKSPLVAAIEYRIGVIEREIERTIPLLGGAREHAQYIDELRGDLENQLEQHTAATKAAPVVS